MSNRKHIYRKFNANHTNRIRYDEDDFRVSIKRFDKTQEKIFKSSQPSTFTHNGVSTSVCGFTVYQASMDEELLKLGFKFTPNKGGYYRLEMLYTNSRKKIGEWENKYCVDVTGTCIVDGEIITKSSVWKGTDVAHSRHYDYFTVEPKNVGKEVDIEYSISSNCGFIALVIKNYEIWQGDKHNEEGHELTIKKASISKTNELDPDTLNLELMYWHKLDEPNVGSDNANRSGYIFDYRDEINFYVTNNNGIEEQVFGGYISTVNVDDDLTTMTIDAVSRLGDLDHRYNVTEVGMNNNALNSEVDYSSCFDYFHNFTDYESPLRYLCYASELPLKTSVPSDDKNQTLNREKIIINYGKNTYNKFTTSNMSATVYGNQVKVRNGSKTNVTQSIRIFDDKLAKWENKIVLSKDRMQNIYIEYGLGEHKWENIIQTEENEDAVNSNPTISADVSKQALNITSLKGSDSGGTNENDVKICKIMVNWVYKHIDQVKYRNFVRKPSTVLKKRGGNCCDKSRLVAQLCMARGVPYNKMWYRHPKDHVLLDLCGVISDPSCGGWNSHCKNYGIGTKVCTVDKLPF